MLTDYHLHLRPDEPGSDAERYFTPANAERYRTVAAERGIEELGVSEHIYRFTAALDVWQHPLWRENACDDLDEYCAFVREETDLRLGIEADSYRHHASRRDWARDHVRNNVLTSLGWRILAVTWDDMVRRPDAVVALLQRARAA